MFHVGWRLFISLSESRPGRGGGRGNLFPVCCHNERVEIPLLLLRSHSCTWALNNNSSIRQTAAGAVVASMLLLHCCCLNSRQNDWSWQLDVANFSTVFHCLWFICLMCSTLKRKCRSMLRTKLQCLSIKIKIIQRKLQTILFLLILFICGYKKG